MIQFCTDLHPQVCSLGAVFTKIVHEGRRGAAEFFTAVDESLEPQQLELRDFIAQGNKIAVLGYQKAKAKLTGGPYEIEFVHLWSVGDGKFTELRLFNNTASLVKALRR